MQKCVSPTYEHSSEPLHISVKKLFPLSGARSPHSCRCIYTSVNSGFAKPKGRREGEREGEGEGEGGGEKRGSERERQREGEGGFERQRGGESRNSSTEEYRKNLDGKRRQRYRGTSLIRNSPPPRTSVGP